MITYFSVYGAAFGSRLPVMHLAVLDWLPFVRENKETSEQIKINRKDE